MKSSDYLLPYPKSVSVECRPDYMLAVEFDTGEHGLLDMKPYLDRGVFKKLREPKAFRKVRIACDTVAWDGECGDIDLHPAVVYYESVKGDNGRNEKK